MTQTATPFTPCPWIRQGLDRFTGRQRELEDILSTLCPPSGEDEDKGNRLVVLTGGAGVGKTALAAAVSEQARQRQVFPGGISELSCEQIREPDHLLARVLETLGGAGAEDLRDDLALRVREVLARRPAARLLVLDHLDDLSAHSGNGSQESTAGISGLFESLLASPDLRILATCRHELGVSELGRKMEVTALSEEESLEVLLTYLDAPEEAASLRRNFAEAESPLHWVLRVIDRRPFTVRLLAYQLRRTGLEPVVLQQEVHRQFLEIVTSYPEVPRDLAHRARSTNRGSLLDGEKLALLEGLLANGFAAAKKSLPYCLAFSHLAPRVRGPFSLLWLVPGGVWCGRFPERWIDWERFFLTDDWKARLSDLCDVGLVEHVTDPSGKSDGWYRLLPEVAEMSRKVYEVSVGHEDDMPEWEKVWIAFWGESLELWESTVFRDSGVRSELLGAAAVGKMQEEVREIFRGSIANLISVIGCLCKKLPQMAGWFLKHSYSFLHADEQWTLERILSRQVIASLRESEYLSTDEGVSQLAASLGQLGVAENASGDHASAVRSLQEAIELYESLIGTPSEDVASRALAFFHLGAAKRDLREPEGALEAYARAQEIWRRLVEKQPPDATVAFRSLLTRAWQEIGDLSFGLGQHEEARDAYEEALRGAIELAEGNPSGFLARVAKAKSNLALVLTELGESEKALRLQREALDAFRRLMEKDPWAHEPQVATVLNSLGALERELGEFQAAREHFEESIEIYTRLATERPGAFDGDLATSLNNLGTLHYDINQPAEALRFFEKALAIQRPLAATCPEQFELDLALTLSNRGNAEHELGRSEAALRSLEEALAIRRRLVEICGEVLEPEVAVTLSNLGSVQQEINQDGPALELLDEALAIYRRLAQKRPAAFEANVAMVLNNLGILKSGLGRHDEALRLFDEALDIDQRLARTQSAGSNSGLAITLNNLGQLMVDTDQTEMARSYFEKSVRTYMKLLRQGVDAHLSPLMAPLKKYIALTPEAPDDEIWQLWRGLEDIVTSFRSSEGDREGDQTKT